VPRLCARISLIWSVSQASLSGRLERGRRRQARKAERETPSIRAEGEIGNSARFASMNRPQG